MSWVKSLVLGAALASIASIAQARQYAIAGETVSEQLYIEVRSVRTNGDIRSAWMTNIFKADAKLGANRVAAVQSHASFDCKAGTSRSDYATHFNAEGATVFDGEVRIDWAKAPPGSNAEKALRLVCGRTPWPAATVSADVPGLIRSYRR
jgi:hypothetical protein